MCLHTKFHANRTTFGKVMTFHIFSRWRPSAILSFMGSSFWLFRPSGTCISTTLPNLASLSHSAVKIWPKLLKPIWPPPPCWIYFRFTFWHIFKIRKTKCVCISNFVEIGQYFAKLWRFVYFQDGIRPPYWILEKFKFWINFWGRSQNLHRHTKFGQNRMISSWNIAIKPKSNHWKSVDNGDDDPVPPV